MKIKHEKMPSLIIVEGPDLAGKSTFITHFDDNKYIKHHFGAESAIKTAAGYFEMMATSMTKLWKDAIILKKDLIIDRSWISDAAYEHIRKDGGRVTDFYKLQYSGLFLGMFRKIATVILIPPFNIIEERYNIRGDDYVTLEQLEKAYKYYNTMRYDINATAYDCVKYGIPINNVAAATFVYDSPHINDKVQKYIKDIENFINCPA